ncbi:DUF5655 domain-containing protein [Arthrobacter sp. BE255]|uniref:DUF5655 domain-containing protein n=1 Tax=Arthrobacter sp. BE255 TaxID=2817721 RepID=UPI0028661548|nr:DUF5655 domain-containing protein [Arthrobacter sp. BE255]MDR7159042.1 hypothetical protein [Arthrobacter sp. BE255]
MVRFSGVVRVRGRNLCLDIPDAARNELMPFADRGRIRVAGHLEGADFSATLIPVKPAGHVLYLSGGLRAATGLNAGDSVVVDVQPQAAGQVGAPGDLALALHKAGTAERWSQLPAAERRELVRFMEDARSQATRARRIGQVVAQLQGRPVVPPGQPTARPLWTCPTCGQAFVTRNMNHSCGLHTLEEPFQRKPPDIRRLFDLVRQAVEALGPVTLVPYKDRVAFMVKVRFAGARPANTWLDVEFWLTRRIDSPRFRKVETLTPYTHIHTVRLTGPADVDDELAGWLREAYEVGCQHHLRER